MKSKQINRVLNQKTKLSDSEEYQFQNWFKYVSKILTWAPNPDDPKHAYDLRGYWKEHRYEPVLPGQHFSDTYKEPTHDTFSVESVKAFNFPQLAGSWEKTTRPIVEDTDVFIPADISDETLKKRQAYAESRFKKDAVSKRGARGIYQIMPAVENDYVASTADSGDIFDATYNEKIRNWKMAQLLRTKAVSGVDENGEVNDVVKLAKQYAAYNWGEGNLGKFLSNKKERGIDIYHSLDWIKDLPKETREYVEFIVFGRDTTGNKNSDFQRTAKVRVSPMIKQMGGLIYTPMYKQRVEIQQSKPKVHVVDESNEQFPVTNVDVVSVDIPQFKDTVETPAITRGKTEYKTSDIDVGNLSEFLTKLEDAGISVRVTSGYRPGAKTSSGKTSRHATRDAIDITPVDGQTYADLIRQIKDNPELVAYMRDNDIGILDETDPIIKAKTKATGDHWHISRGGETAAIYGRDKLLA